ncbi:hypothetical protein COLO4_37360 [Corchorus olitorius]|uniref:F-box domain-containing protein n=1 Tax=Corchorus olitorius TaxID=93759 RepID=A0A1R3G2A1_9ROSI|nr:hypothetical protein COLO4_37360 [Corchorus olitorius]
MNFTYNPADESRSAETIANSHDLLIEILVRLPLKSLVRFKSVSEGWNSVISDPYFSRRLFPHISGLIIEKLYTLDDNPQYQLIPLTSPGKLTDNASLNFSLPKGFKIVQSCHGLLLCRKGDSSYYIYNPTTKQFVSLPPNLDTRNSKTNYLNLAFDPTKSPHYKVVCVRFADQGLNFSDKPGWNLKKQIEIYSSQTRSWRLSGNAFTVSGSAFTVPLGYTTFREGVFCNGAIHWINHVDHSMLYFHMDDEKLGQLPLPNNIPSKLELRYMTYLMECRGHLHLIGTCLPPTELRVQEIESDYSGWIVKYHVDLRPLTVAFPETWPTWPLCYLSFLFIVREANDEDSYMVLHLHSQGKVIRLNLKDGHFNKICDLDPVGNDQDFPRPFLSNPLSLFSPHHQFIQTLSSV